MPPETAKLLEDMRRAGECIARFTAGKTYDDFIKDELLRSGVERQFEIIGEAMTRLIRRDNATAQMITDYRKITGFRNALIHGYDSIDDETSWGIVTLKLPILMQELEKLTKDAPPPNPGQSVPDPE
jgi:uncharacterized protein with HEPN domain